MASFLFWCARHTEYSDSTSWTSSDTHALRFVLLLLSAMHMLIHTMRTNQIYPLLYSYFL